MGFRSLQKKLENVHFYSLEWNRFPRTIFDVGTLILSQWLQSGRLAKNDMNRTRLPKNCLSFEFCKFYNQSTQDFPYSLHRWHFHNHVINQFVFFFLCLFDCITRTQNIIESYFVLLCKSEMLLWILFGQSYPSTVSYCLSNQNASRDIHIECSKQFKRNLHFYVSGSSGPFWAVLKLP